MTKEEIYDSEIYPMVDRIIEICKANKISMFATFAIPNTEDPDLYCTTMLPDESGKSPDKIKACYGCLMASHQFSGPLILKTEHGDGSKTLTAILG